MLGAVSPDSFDTLHSYSNTFQMPFVTPWFPEKVNFITHFIVQSFSTTEIYLFCFKFWLQHFRYFLLLFLITLCNQICDCLQEITNCSHSKQISILFLYFNLFNIFKVVVILQMFLYYAHFWNVQSIHFFYIYFLIWMFQLIISSRWVKESRYLKPFTTIRNIQLAIINN